MRLVALLSGLVALFVIAEPASAHHKPGHQGGPPHGENHGRADRSGPDSGPGNSGAAQWCKAHFDDAGRGDPFPFKNRGQCVSFFARGGESNDADHSTGGEPNGQNFIITAVQVDHHGTFVVRGVGAEDRVLATVGDVSGKVVGFGETWPAIDGSWEVRGEWACQDDDDAHDAQFIVRDSDESHRFRASFACDELVD